MRRFFWELDLLFNGRHFGFGDDLHFKKKWTGFTHGPLPWSLANIGQVVHEKKMFEIFSKRTTFWPYGGHLWWLNHLIATNNAPEWSSRWYLQFDILYDHILSKMKFEPYLTPRATPNFDRGPPYEQIWNSDKYRSFIPSFVEIGLAVCENIFRELYLLFNGGQLGFGDDLHFNKNEQASSTDHYREVWPISAKRFTRRRRLKYLVKERPFDLSAAILDDVIVWFRQQML